MNIEDMKKNRITPEWIDSLKDNEIFVFGSNLAGMQGGVDTIRPYVDEFVAFAQQHPDQHFLVTPIGCGIAGFEPEDIAPLFEAAKEVENISLPENFWEVIE